MELRAESGEDVEAIDVVVEAAFGHRDEADLVGRLRSVPGYAGFVAVDGDAVVGHVAFSPVTLDPPTERHVVGLAPLSVLPNVQRTGIGTALTEHGLEALRAVGVEAVVVLGDPAYYARFGFAAREGLTCTYEVPADHFMVRALRDGAEALDGLVHYHPVFGG